MLSLGEAATLHCRVWGIHYVKAHMSTFRCPLCQGPLAAWVVREEFTCHHCSWAIRSNCGHAFAWALVVGLLAEIALLVSLWVFLPGKLDPLVVWLSLGSMAGYLLGYFTFRAKMVLVPVRPQRALTDHSSGASSASAEFQR